MILSDRTIKILKNCADINESIVINKGSKIKTINKGKFILFHSDIDEVFPCDVWIYDLKLFVDLCQNKMKGANIDFLPFPNDEGVAETLLFRKGIQEYFFKIKMEDVMYIIQPEGEIDHFEPTGSFDLLNDVFHPLLISAKKFELNDLCIYGDSESNSLYADFQNILNDYSSSQRIKIANNLNTDNWFLENTERNLVLKRKNCKILPSDYRVTFMEGICLFESPGGYLKYWVALEPTSNYG